MFDAHLLLIAARPAGIGVGLELERHLLGLAHLLRRWHRATGRACRVLLLLQLCHLGLVVPLQALDLRGCVRGGGESEHTGGISRRRKRSSTPAQAHPLLHTRLLICIASLSASLNALSARRLSRTAEWRERADVKIPGKQGKRGGGTGSRQNRTVPW